MPCSRAVPDNLVNSVSRTHYLWAGSQAHYQLSNQPSKSIFQIFAIFGRKSVGVGCGVAEGREAVLCHTSGLVLMP